VTSEHRENIISIGVHVTLDYFDYDKEMTAEGEGKMSDFVPRPSRSA